MNATTPIFEKVFSHEEFASRVHDVKLRMERAGYDLIICQDPSNMCWLTGYDGWSFYVPQCVLVHLQEDSPFWFGRAQDAKAARVTTYLPDENIIQYSESLVQHPVDHPYDELVELIQTKRWAGDRIGVEMDAHYYTARCHSTLANALSNARIENNGDLVNWARLVKSDKEIELMREAGQICTQTMNSAISKIRAGVPQNQVIAEIYRAQISGVNGCGGDYASFAPLIQVGEGTSTPHLTWSDAPLPNEVLTMIEIAGVRRRYNAPLTRTIHIGKAPDKVRDLAKVIVEGVDVGLALARPGNTCEMVEAGWQGVLNRNGLTKDSRVGYSIGVGYPPDWGERTCSLRPGDSTVLEAGMCFHFQSGVWLSDFGCAVSESFVVTHSGGERLCNVERDLIVVE